MNQSPPQLNTIKITQAKNLEENQVRSLMQSFFDAIRLRDIHGILSCYDDTVVVYDVRDALQINKTSLRRSWQECFDTSSEFTTEALDLHVDVDQNFAHTFGLLHSKGVTTEGEKVDLWMRATHVLRKVDGRWLIVHEHMSLPGDFISGKLLQSLKPTKFN